MSVSSLMNDMFKSGYWYKIVYLLLTTVTMHLDVSKMVGNVAIARLKNVCKDV